MTSPKNNVFYQPTKFELNNFTWIYKFFLENYRYYDISIKSNGTFWSTIDLPQTFNSNVTLPLVSTQNDNTAKLKFLMQSLRLIWLFTFQKSFIKKKLILQQQKKKSSCYILQTKTTYNYSYNRFFYYLLTILPYTRLSYGYDKAIVVSDIQGCINFNILDLTFFSNIIKDKLIHWDRQINFSFNWILKKIKNKRPNREFFIKIPFVKSMFFRLMWSSVGLKCSRGHGGWSTFSKFTKTVIYSNKIFFWKNFKL